MLYPSSQGFPSLVSEDFNAMCTQFRVEARIEPFPNPGDPFHPMRKISFRNFNEYTLFVYQLTPKGEKKVTLPASSKSGTGNCEILIAPQDPLPWLGKE